MKTAPRITLTITVLLLDCIGCTVQQQLEKTGGRVSQNEQGQIVSVDFSSTQTTDEGVVYLAGLTKLNFLQVVDTQVTEEGVAELYHWSLTTAVTDSLKATGPVEDEC